MADLGFGTVARIEQSRRFPRPDTQARITAALMKLGAVTPAQARRIDMIHDMVAWSEHPEMRHVPPEVQQLFQSMRYELYGSPYAPGHLPLTWPSEMLIGVLAQRGFTQGGLAKTLGVGPEYISKLAHGHQRFSPRVALQLEAALSGEPSAAFWVNLQREVDLAETRERMAAQLERIRERAL